MEDKLAVLPFIFLSVSQIIIFFVLSFRIDRIERKLEKRTETHGVCLDATIIRRMILDAIQKDRETSWKDLENDDVEYRNGCDDGYAYSMQTISELLSVERREDEWCKDCKKYDQEKHCCPRYNRVIREALDDVEKQKVPTIERKKGKWIGEPKDGIEAMFFKPKCSVCGFESADGKNYCPNCGARMEEK